MKQKTFQAICCAVALSLIVTGCSKHQDPAVAEAPPQPAVEHVPDGQFIQVADATHFPLFAAARHLATSSLSVTGAVAPDISREIPVVTLASGRVIDTRVRIGDVVKKGQLLMEIQSNDIAGAFATYLKAVNDERLARLQLDRSTLLFDKGAIPKSQLELAQNGEDDAKAALTASEEQLRVLGVDKDSPSAAVKVYAPASGIIIQQNVTAAGAAGVTYGGSANAFTIADLSHVWIICDVYENDLSTVRVGQNADIRLNAYPDKHFWGTISEIDPMLDPTIRTAKVRIQVNNPDGILRIGMFATATFHGHKSEMHSAIPSAAILRLHDRAWVFSPVGKGKFQRLGVQLGEPLPNGMQEVNLGLSPGQQVVANALELQQSLEQQ